MNTLNQPVCQCVACAGSSCDCGCQMPVEQKDCTGAPQCECRSQCECGTQCSCTRG